LARQKSVRLGSAEQADFHWTLPIQERATWPSSTGPKFDSSASARQQPWHCRSRKTMTKKILVVDDSKTALMMEREILERRTTYQCVTASDGREAVEKAQQERPDLILMDVVMPHMNGFEACKMMRQQASTREIPIVLVTTRGEESYMEAGFQSGCNDYITKPIDSAELIALLQSYLGE
jgi:two-component system alkaline phosphatase synthesis response regulator PhoP